MEKIIKKIIPAKLYLRIKYKKEFKKKLDLKNPLTFNEKLQWLKLYDRNIIYTTMVDKYEVKKYVADIIGRNYLIPTIGVYNSFDQIDFNKLPNQFVIKCTHDSGGIVVVKNKSKIDLNKVRKKINNAMNRNFYYESMEWPYKNVKARIIIEKYLEDESKTELKDYKVFCFNGQPKMIMVDSGRFSNHVRNVYDVNWKKMDVSINFPNDDNLIVNRPNCLNKMLKFSKILSKNIPFIRVDFYVVGDDLYFGELTLYPGAGFQKIIPEEWQYKLGNMIDLKRNEVYESNVKKGNK